MSLIDASERNISRQYSTFSFVNHFGCVSGLRCRTVQALGRPITDDVGNDVIIASGVCESILLTNQSLGGKLVNRLQVRETGVEVVCFGQVPNYPLIVIGFNDGIVFSCKMASITDQNPELSALDGHKRAVECLAFSSNRKCVVATGSRDRSVIVWDLIAERGLFRLKGHMDSVQCLKFVQLSEDSEFLISGSKDKCIRVWDIELAQCVKCLSDSSSEIWALNVIDNRFLISGDSGNTLHVHEMSLSLDEHNISDKLTFRQMSDIDRGGRRKTTSLISTDFGFACIDAGGRAVRCFRYFGAEKALKRSRKRNGTEIDSQDAFTILRVDDERNSKFRCIGTYGSGVVASTLNNSICLIAVKDLEVQKPIRHSFGHSDIIHAIELSKDEQLLATADSTSLMIWNIRSREPFRSFQGLENQITICRFSPTAENLIAGDNSGNLLVFNLLERTIELNQKIHDDVIVGLITLADQSQLITASKDCRLCVWEREESSTLNLSRHQTFSDHVTALAVSPNHQLILCALIDCTIKVVFADTLKLFLNLYGHAGPVQSMDVSFDSEMLITGSTDRTIRIWGLRFGDCRRALVYHEDSIVAVKFIPDTYHLFAASKDSKISRWDAEHFQRIQTLEQSHFGPISGMAAGLQTVVTASFDRSIRMWKQTDAILIPKVEISKEQGELAEKEDADIALPHKGRDESVAALITRTENVLELADQLIEMLEIVKNKDSAGSDQITANLVMAKFKVAEVDDIVVCHLRRIKPNLLNSVLLLVPFSLVPLLFDLLSAALEKCVDVEICVKCTLFLVVHHQSVILSSELKYQAEKLAKLASDRIRRLFSTLESNTAALDVIQLQLAPSHANLANPLIPQKSQGRKKKNVPSKSASFLAASLARHMTYRIVVSLSNCVYHNLAAENHIFAKCSQLAKKDATFLFLYRNNPCVVLGKHQNPWLECNIRYAQRIIECAVGLTSWENTHCTTRVETKSKTKSHYTLRQFRSPKTAQPIFAAYAHQHGIMVSRRASGGGTVFHDLGNSNISIITNDQRLNRDLCTQSIHRGLYDDSTNACRKTDTHGDPILSKISGSAGRLSRGTLMHHCSLLLNTNLDVMKSVLSPAGSNNNNEIEPGTAIGSQRAESVANLAEHYGAKRSNWLDLIDEGAKSIWNQLPNGISENRPQLDLVNPLQCQDIVRESENLKSWEYVYGQTPKFKVNLKNGDRLQIERGVVVSSSDGGNQGKRFDELLLSGSRGNSHKNKRVFV